VYYIKVTPYNSSYSGTYRIAFNTSSTPPLPSGNAAVTTLITGVWADGTVTAGGEQWFKFTATAYMHYIHAGFDTLTSLNVQVYNAASGSTIGDNSNITSSSSNKYIQRSLTSGQEYYIRVTPNDSNSGTYQIAFNTSATPPSPNITLATGAWTDGNIAVSGGEQWFKFTATATPQFIHVDLDLDTLNDLYVQLYDLNGAMVETTANLDVSTTNVSRPVTIGQVYYIRVTPRSSSGNGTYKIAFNTTSSFAPVASVTATQLAVGAWTNGNIAVSSGEQWFKFTATAITQFIHAGFTTLASLNVQVYDSSGSTVGSQTNLTGTTTNISRTVTSGQVYYIRVTPYNSGSSGAYRIAFNTAPTPPGAAVTQLSRDNWTNGNISSGGEQWFSFTTTAATQYIHADFVTLNSSYGLYVQLYNSNGSTAGSQTRLYGSTTYTSQAVTNEQVYYIKVTPYNSSYTGTYKIAFNTLPAAPGAVTALATGNWTDGSISSGGEQWFSFTATADTQQCIHASFVALNSSYGLYVQLYNSNGSTAGSQTRLYSSTTYTSQTVTKGQVYYIKVTPYNTSSGTYKIAFNKTSSFAPVAGVTATTLTTAGVWNDGSVTANGEQWFKFTATAVTQYIHVMFNTLTNLYVQMYDSEGSTVGSQTNLTGSTKYISRDVTSGQVYYIKVTPNSGYNGTYRIVFNASSMTP
jgi:hypothetical protein